MSAADRKWSEDKVIELNDRFHSTHKPSWPCSALKGLCQWVVRERVTEIITYFVCIKFVSVEVRRRKRHNLIFHSISLCTKGRNSFSDHLNAPLYQKPIIGGSNYGNEVLSHRLAILLAASRQSHHTNSWLYKLEQAPALLIP